MAASRRTARTETTLIVALEDDQRFDEVVARLCEAGMIIRQKMPALGTVTGTIAAGKAGQIRRIPGVASARPSGRLEAK
jgi:hypothetical protein